MTRFVSSTQFTIINMFLHVLMVHGLQVTVHVRLPHLPQQLLQLLDLHLPRLLQVLVQQGGLHLFTLSPQVRRQLQTMNST